MLEFSNLYVPSGACVTMDQCQIHYVSPYFVVSIYLPTPKTKMILEVTQIKKNRL